MEINIDPGYFKTKAWRKWFFYGPQKGHETGDYRSCIAIADHGIFIRDDGLYLDPATH